MLAENFRQKCSPAIGRFEGAAPQQGANQKPGSLHDLVGARNQRPVQRINNRESLIVGQFSERFAEYGRPSGTVKAWRPEHLHQ